VGRSKAREEWVSRRWDRERGIWMIAYNNCLALVRAPVEDVCGALKGKTSRWERDVLGGEVVVAEEGLFVFRLRGHAWSEVLHNHCHSCPYAFTEAWAKLLSRRLGTRAVFYCVTDTCGGTGYSLFETGRLLEEFNATEGEPWTFRSEVRTAPMRIADIWAFAWRFFVEQDAFEPFIDFNYFFGRQEGRTGERLIVQNPGHELAGAGVSRPGLERVDYLELRPPRRARAR
jgi:hypothetical protein